MAAGICHCLFHQSESVGRSAKPKRKKERVSGNGGRGRKHKKCAAENRFWFDFYSTRKPACVFICYIGGPMGKLHYQILLFLSLQNTSVRTCSSERTERENTSQMSEAVFIFCYFYLIKHCPYFLHIFSVLFKKKKISMDERIFPVLFIYCPTKFFQLYSFMVPVFYFS